MIKRIRIGKRGEQNLRILLSLISMALMIYIGTTLFKRARLDVTEEGLYTISEGTKAILANIDRPMKLKLYYSKTAANKGTEGLRAFNNHFLYVQELLREYVSHSRNNLSLEVIDPRPDTPEEESAMMHGLRRFDLTETERYFFGLVAENQSGTEKMIEFFDPSGKDRLEYELTKLIYTTLNPQKKTVGILSSLEVMAEEMNPYMAQMMRMQGRGPPRSWLVVTMLEEFYTVKRVERETDSIVGLDALVVVHPKGFPEKTLFAIDQYLMKGGKVLVFVDPNAVSDQGGMGLGGPSVSPDEGTRKLLSAWGLESPEGTFAGDKALSGVGRLSRSGPPSRLLALVNCDARCSEAHRDTTTSGIDNAVFIFPGVLSALEREGLIHTAILSTTGRGNSYRATEVEFNDQEALWNRFEEGKGEEGVALGFKAVGRFKSAFPDGFKEGGGDEGPAGEAILESQKESAVMVFSDVDFLRDQFAFKNSFFGPTVANDNSTLFLNSVEALVGDVDLMSVRSKGALNRTFDVINEIETKARAQTADKVGEINANIARFQRELNELGRQANEGNIALLQNEGLRKKRQLARQIALLRGELRAVKREGREQIEGIGKFFQYLNTLFVPALVIGFGIYYSRKRHNLTRGRVKA